MCIRDRDIICGEVFGPQDPNDKQAFPSGVQAEHLIVPNRQVEYVVRFQNTGNDTAFHVVIRDTLDTDLNIFSISPGVASHPYTFKLYGPRIAEWKFPGIALPDSNINFDASQGFVTFTICLLYT